MKGQIYIAVILMIGLMVIGCTGTTANQRKEEPGLSTSVGNAAFVGSIPTQAEDVNGIFGN